jgi:DNA-nicking Smr family endonuclease
MNFGDILSQWEKDPRRSRTVDKDLVVAQAEARRTENLTSLRPEAHIDLHGFTRDEAWEALDRFISLCCRQNLRKVLIIHGKGNHPGSDAVLSRTVRTFIECDHRLGASGHPNARSGGSGATWVAIKKGRPVQPE